MAKRTKNIPPNQELQIVLECLTSDREDAEIPRAYRNMGHRSTSAHIVSDKGN